MSTDNHDLDERVFQFRLMELPGQPMMMHMGTNRLVNDLHAELKRERARVAELESVLVRGVEGEEYFWRDDAEKALNGSSTAAWLLRQKADAVDAIAENMVRDMTVSDIRMVASLHRQAADEADKAGGGDE
jgi:hypothetical protein